MLNCKSESLVNGEKQSERWWQTVPDVRTTNCKRASPEFELDAVLHQQPVQCNADHSTLFNEV